MSVSVNVSLLNKMAVNSSFDRADLVIAIVIVKGDAGDVISVACGGNEHGVETNLHSRLLTQLV
jgi:hypothetical protein